MAGLGTHLCPGAADGVAVGPFYHVEDFLDVGGHVFHGDAALLTAIAGGIGGGVLARHAGGEHGQWLGTDVLAELEELKESQTAGLVVTPDVEVGLSVLQRTHGVVPVVDVVETLAVTHAPAGETHELGLQVGDGLGKVVA